MPVTYKELLSAYYDCRKRKRTKSQATSFEIDYEHNLVKLLDEINNKTYEPDPIRTFVVTEPSYREVWASYFRDRIVHHLIYNRLAPKIEPTFIEDTYSCISNKGTLRAWKKVEKYARMETNNWDVPAYFLKMDVSNYFVSINRDILWEIVEKLIPENTKELSWLIEQNVKLDPTKNCIQTTPELLDKIPPHKSLWHVPKNHGLPIGNLTSQFYSNIYLDDADHYAKHVLKCKKYVRYVDDIVVISKDLDFLEDVKKKYNRRIMETRELKLNANKSFIKPLSAGIDFLGVKILPWRTYALNRNVGKAMLSYKWEAIASYIGLLKHTNSRLFVNALENRLKTTRLFTHGTRS